MFDSFNLQVLSVAKTILHLGFANAIGTTFWMTGDCWLVASLKRWGLHFVHKWLDWCSEGAWNTGWNTLSVLIETCIARFVHFFPCLSNVPTWCGLPLLLARPRLWLTKFHRQGVILTHGNLLAYVRWHVQYYRLSSEDRNCRNCLSISVQCGSSLVQRKFVLIIVPITVARNQ